MKQNIKIATMLLCSMLHLNIISSGHDRTTGKPRGKRPPRITRQLNQVTQNLEDGDFQEAWENFKSLIPRRLQTSFEKRKETVKKISDTLKKIKFKGRKQRKMVSRWVDERLHEHYFNKDNFRKEREEFKDNYVTWLKQEHVKAHKKLEGASFKKQKELEVEQKAQLKHIQDDKGFQAAAEPLERNINARMRAGIAAKTSKAAQLDPQQLYLNLHSELVEQRNRQYMTDYGAKLKAEQDRQKKEAQAAKKAQEDAAAAHAKQAEAETGFFGTVKRFMGLTQDQPEGTDPPPAAAA